MTRAGKGAGWATTPEAEDLLAASLRLARQPQAASRAPGTCRSAASMTRTLACALALVAPRAPVANGRAQQVVWPLLTLCA